MATPLSTISDAAQRDWTNETVTAAKLETDPANIVVAVNLVLDYLAELETNFAGATTPADITTGFTYFNNSDNRLELRRSGAQETVLSEGTAGTASIAAGGGTDRFSAGGRLKSHTYTASADAAGATGALIYASLSASTLNASGQTLCMIAWGTKTGSSSAATMDVYWNSTALGTLGLSANCTNWLARVYLTYTSAAAQKVAAEIRPNRDDTGRTDLCFVTTGAISNTAAAAFGLEASSVGALDTLSQTGALFFWWG